MVWVREFEERDVAPANALTNGFIRGTAVHFGYEEATDAQFRAVWEKGSGRYPWLAAEVDVPSSGEGGVGGFAGYAKSSAWRERDAYRFTAETTVYVEPWAHRRGVGRALMVELFERLRGAGFRRAVAGITLPNEGSVRLHEALGFTKVGVFREVGYKFETWWDVGFWERGV